MMDGQFPDFAGAKLALFIGEDLVVLERDDSPGIAWPEYLDLPGGGRENGESPEACVLRETQEELGLRLNESDLIWRRFYPGATVPAWFFAAHLPVGRRNDVRFGDEGRGWCLMRLETYLEHRRGIPHFQARLKTYLSEQA